CRQVDWPVLTFTLLATGRPAKSTTTEAASHATKATAAKMAAAAAHARLLFGQVVQAEILIVNAWPQRGVPFGRDERPGQELRLMQIHDKRDRPAADERQLNVVPVLCRGVVDNCPALQQGRLVVLEHQSIAGFPKRCFLDVADRHIPLTGATEVELDLLLIVAARGGEQIE